MAKTKSGKSPFKFILPIFLVIGSITIVGTVGYFVIKGLEAAGIGNKVKDENSLIIGVEKEHDSAPVGINFKLKDGDNVYIDKTIWSNDPTQMKEVEGQSNELVFHDFTKEIARYIGSSGVFYWINAADGWRNHSITVSTICLDGAIKSTDYYVSDSGIYWIGVALENGDEPCATSYAGIYHTQILPKIGE